MERRVPAVDRHRGHRRDGGDGHQQQSNSGAESGDPAIAKTPSPKPLGAGDRPRHDRLFSPGIGAGRRPGRATSGYRRAGSFSRHFRQIVSMSRGILGWSCEGGTGSLLRTMSSVSRTDAPPERRPTGEQLVKDRPERVLVGGRPDLVRLAEGLFGGHVARRAEDRAGTGLARVVLEPLDQAEVGDLRACRRRRAGRWPA